MPEEEREGAVSGEAWRRQVLGYSTTTSPSDWTASTTAWELVSDSTATACTRRIVVVFTATTAWPDP